MSLKANRLRALKGCMQSALIESRKLYIIAASIIFGYIALSSVLVLVFLAQIEGSNNNGGAMTNGFGVAAICMFIVAIVMTGEKQRKAMFAFPIDRITYSLGNFFMLYINTAIILLIASFGYLTEILVYKTISAFNENFIYVNIVTREAFLVGFFVSLLYVGLLATINHFVFMTIARYKIFTLIGFAIVIGLPFTFPFGRTVFLKAFMFLAGENSLLILCIKLLVFSLIFQVLSFLRLRKMEVNG